MIRFFAVGIEDSGKSTCTYSGKYFRPDAMFMQSLHNPQMGKSFYKSSAQGITNVIFKFIHSLISFRYRQTYEYFCEMP